MLAVWLLDSFYRAGPQRRETGLAKNLLSTPRAANRLVAVRAWPAFPSFASVLPVRGQGSIVIRRQGAMGLDGDEQEGVA